MEPPPAEPPPVEEPPSSVLDGLLKARLLRADVREPVGGLGAAGAEWVRGWVDRELSIEAELIATSARPGESLRDLVWLAPEGELLVAEGARFATSEDEASTLEFVLQIGRNRRFVAWVDLDGDGVRDWLFEDLLSGEILRRSGASGAVGSARSAELPASMRILGTGEFEADGTTALVFADEPGRLRLERAADGQALVAADAALPTDYQLIAIADVSGDGRDELIARDAFGGLAVGILTPTPEGAGASPLELAWASHTLPVAATAELVATADLDGDGQAELLFRVADGVEIWALDESAPRPF